MDNPRDAAVTWTKIDLNSSGSYVLLSIRDSLTLKDDRFQLEVSNDNRSYVLKIKNIESMDTAKYECKMIISTTQNVINTVELLVRTPPKISDKLVMFPRAVPLGETTTLTCLADGYPRPSVTWTRAYNAILPGGGQTFSGNELKLKEVTKLDRGTYYCTAENEVGKDRRNVNFEVEFAPVISVPRPKVAQATDYDIDLECIVEANPSPTILWFKEGETILNDGDHSISNTATTDQKTTSVLRVISVQEDKYGDYYCKASNKVGNAEARLNLFESIIKVYA